MWDELNQAIETYHEKWHTLVRDRQDKPFFNALQPTAVAWKTEDIADFDRRFAELREHADQIHFGWVNDRWLVTLSMRDELSCGLKLVKLMQRRPGSSDPTGLDHFDFLLDKNTDAKAVLAAEPNLKWTEEKNGDHCKWLSIWFDDTEAKLRSDTVLDVCIAEMQDVNKAIQNPMKIDFIFISGNQHKADYLAKWLGAKVEHRKLDLDEIQSLDPRAVAEHKVRQAYAQVQRPVLVDDVSLTFTAMGHLPGTLIKWFLEELEPEGLCKMVDGLPTRAAVASMMYALYDGKELHTFSATISGKIAPTPRSAADFTWKGSWNTIFIPDGSTKTYAEMTDDELKPFSHRAQAVAKLREYLQTL
jgi:non-canonical purine NTP pyrophosphatase (RdgB/HAM1 family)